MGLVGKARLFCPTNSGKWAEGIKMGGCTPGESATCAVTGCWGKMYSFIVDQMIRLQFCYFTVDII